MKRIVVLVVGSLILLASMAPIVHAQEKQEGQDLPSETEEILTRDELEAIAAEYGMV